MNYCIEPYNRISLWPSVGGNVSGLFYTSLPQFMELERTDGYEANLATIFPHLPTAWLPIIAAQLKVCPTCMFMANYLLCTMPGSLHALGQALN